jgi:hypothetical protein
VERARGAAGRRQRTGEAREAVDGTWIDEASTAAREERSEQIR